MRSLFPALFPVFDFVHNLFVGAGNPLDTDWVSGGEVDDRLRHLDADEFEEGGDDWEAGPKLKPLLLTAVAVAHVKVGLSLIPRCEWTLSADHHSELALRLSFLKGDPENHVFDFYFGGQTVDFELLPKEACDVLLLSGVDENVDRNVVLADEINGLLPIRFELVKSLYFLNERSDNLHCSLLVEDDRLNLSLSKHKLIQKGQLLTVELVGLEAEGDPAFLLLGGEGHIEGELFGEIGRWDR